MLNAQDIANYLTEKLDKIGLSRSVPYEFSLLAEVGKGYEAGKINGIVITLSGDPAPVPSGYVEWKYVFAVRMFVSGPTNARYFRVKSIVDELILNNQDSVVAFGNGSGVLTFTPSIPKGYKIEYGLGEGTPVDFTVSVTYTENAVSSGDKHWLLDGVEIPYLSESVSVEREGISRKVYTEVYSKILLTGQTKFYTFRIPYESATFYKLQTEILKSPAVGGIVHTLSYYDGVAFTKDNPYTSKVSIYRSANSASTRPNGSAYDVTFSDVYDAWGKSLQYFISLIDFPFDMQGDDTRYFNSVAEQTQYFEEKAEASSAPFVEVKAPNLDNLVITQQIYYNPSAGAVAQFDYASKNYAVIKVVSAEKTYYFYYFIEKSTIGADGYVLCDLRLDSVQTYFFNPEITFSDCLIERAHLNRFEAVEGTDYVKYVSDPASKIFNSEDGLSFPKRLVKREKLNLKFTEEDDMDRWLNENIDYWVYVFIDPNHTYKVGELQSPYEGGKISVANGAYNNKYPHGMSGATATVCYPVYKNAKNLSDFYQATTENVIVCKTIRFPTAVGTNIDIVPSYIGRESFEEDNAEDKEKTQVSYFYTIKISILPPFDKQQGKYSIDRKNSLILSYQQHGSGGTIAYPAFITPPTEIVTNNKGVDIIRTGKLENENQGVFIGTQQTRGHIESYAYKLSENAPILKSDIAKQQAPNLSYNPKLNGQNFKELVITSACGDTFTYDIQKLVDDSITFEYSEPITPEITKYYMRVKGGTGLYEKGTDENYTGLVGSTDNSLAFANSQYAEFIANNKNFYLQSNMKIITGAAEGLIGGIGKALTGDLAGGAKDALFSGVRAGLSAIDRSLTVDNMKNAPSQLKNANGNVIFNSFVTELGLYVEKYSALEVDLRKANSFMNLYGFTYGDSGNIKNFVHIRKYHNYIKAQLQSINGNLSNVAREDLRQRFANGVRFWNSDTVEYKYENYELWLEAAKPIIAFTIENDAGIPIGYRAEEQMNWKQWVASPYNTGGFSVSGGRVRQGNYIIGLNGTPANPADEILARTVYQIVMIAP